MKNRILFAVSFFLSSLFLSSCLPGVESLFTPDYSLVTATVTATATNTASYVSGTYIPLASSTKTLQISGDLGGKTVYLAKTNPTATLIEANYSRAVLGASNNITVNTSSSRAAEESSSSDDFDIHEACGFLHQNFTFPELDSSPARSSSDSGSVAVNRTGSQLDLTVNSTKKSIWMENKDSWTSAADFTHKPATLRAKGTYCNVWVDDDCYTTGTSSGKQINSALAQEMAVFFDDIYKMEQKLWGKESDRILYYDKASNSLVLKPIKYLDDTGAKVNLVVMDVGNTYNASTGKDEGTTLGYFSPKDFFPNQSDAQAMGYSASWKYGHSNEGKYLYINASTCITAIANLRTIITHEFQHLLTFDLQTIKIYGDKKVLVMAGSAFYEMMAMVGEDFIQEYTKSKYSDFNYDNTPFGWRLPGFNANYYLSGIEYRNDSSGKYVGKSYAVNYAFGAWLVRKYGGAKLANYMENNPKIVSTGIDDYGTITTAVNAVNNTSVTMEKLLAEFAYDTTVPNSKSGTNAFMKESELSSSDELYCESPAYGFKLTGVDLWNLNNYITQTENNSPYLYGPSFFKASAVASGGVRPYGMELNKVGTIAAGATSITLVFNSVSSSRLKTYVIIE